MRTKLSSFNYILPKELIAQYPSEERDLSRLMVVHRDTGKIEHKIFKDLLNYFNDGGTELAVSIDNQEPVILNMNKDDQLKTWEGWVSNNINKVVSTHVVDQPGKHTLKVWMIDPGVVLQRVIIDCGGLKSSYLGPTESTKITE